MDLMKYSDFQELLSSSLSQYYEGRWAYFSEVINIIKENEGINTKIVIKEELREINMGTWDTLTLEERYASDGDYAKEWANHLKDLPYPDGECGEDVCIRAMKVIDEIIEKEYKDVAIVTSGGTIPILLSNFLGLDQHKRFNMDIDNCSISIAKCNIISNKITVQCINDTGHLDDLI